MQYDARRRIALTIGWCRCPLVLFVLVKMLGSIKLYEVVHYNKIIKFSAAIAQPQAGRLFYSGA